MKLLATITRKIILVASLILSVTLTYSQEIKFDRLSVENGLSQDNVLWIHQDSMGFIWIATEDGLNLYDGYSFRIFKNIAGDSASLSNNHVLFIAEDTTGNIWVGTQNGLNLYDRESENFHRFFNVSGDPYSLTNNEVDYLFFDSKQNLWVGTASGVNLYNPKTKSFHRFVPDQHDPASIPEGIIRCIMEDHDHQLWFATMSGLSRMNPDSTTFTNYLHDPDEPGSIASNQVTSLFEEDNNHLWVGTIDAGLDLMDRRSGLFVHYPYEPDNPHGLLSPYIKNINKDQQGRLWLATDGGLNLMYPDRTYESYIHSPDNEYSLASNILSQVYFDVNDRMWVATRFGGINVYDRDKSGFRHYKHSSLDPYSLSGDNVTAFAEDRNGNFWVGVDGGGLNFMNRTTGRFSHMKHQPGNPNSISNNKVLALAFDSRGELWLGYWDGGVDRYNPETGKFIHYKSDPEDQKSLSDNNIFYIMEDSRQQIWIATWGNGVCRFNRETGDFTRFTHDPDDPKTIGASSVDFMAEDKQGNIWIAFERYGGVDMFDPGKNIFTHYTAGGKKGDISENAVYSLLVDTKGRLWAGTNGGGLNQFNRKTKTFTTYHVSDGLPNETIMGILEDNEHNLWLSTNKGISRFNPDSITFKNYDQSDGLQSNQFNRWSFKRLSDGELLFGGVNGFNLFDPENIKENEYVPPVYITGFKLFNEPVEPGRNSVLKRNILLTKEIRLNYKQNFFSFDFTALNYRQPEKNKYKYRMLGMQDNWVNAGTDRKATFTNMSPGEYVFQVIASNNDGVWNEEGTSLRITIIPPYWRTKWFITLMVLMITGSIIIFIRIRERSLKHDKASLEARIQEGLKVVEEQKAEVERKNKEIKEREIAEREQKWYNTGMVKFSEILSKNKDNVEQLSLAVIRNLAKYTGAAQGVIYVYEEHERKEPFLKLTGSYAPDAIRNERTEILIGEGQVGTCFKERETIQLENLPETYATLTSGIGDSPLTSALLVPLKLNEIILGVIELTSFEKLEVYKVKFIEKLGESITSYLMTLQASYKSTKLLEQSQSAAEAIASQEEEIRQNMEEMQATQDESARREQEFIKREADFKKKIALLKRENTNLKAKMKK